MVDENVVDREVGLEVIRRGLATREALLGFVQQRRANPSRSFTTVLVLNGVLTPELGTELDRIARERAAAGGTPLPAPPRPAPGPAPGVGDRTKSGRVLPPPGVGDRTPSGKINRASGSHVNIEMPQHTVMDLDLEVPVAAPSQSDADRAPKKPADVKNPKKFQAARTALDGHAGNADGQRTMLEDALEMPVAEGGRTMLEDNLEMPAAEGGRTMLEENLEMPGAVPESARTMMLESLEMPGGPAAPAAPAAPVGPADTADAPPVAAHEQPGAPVDETKRPPAPAPGRRPAPSGGGPVLTVGKYFGDFEVISTLGEGAMGQVFRAKRRSDGLEVALKVMRGGLIASAKVKERFLREAKAAKLIKHPNVVTFIDAGMIASDQFLAMEFVDGRSLQAVLNEKPGKPLPFTRAFEVFRQITAGLAAAHEAGVIHRDLKPENILVTREGEIPKITDFGLARREEESMLLTRPGQIMGSPYYMAPEQGQGLPVDARADLYSLGAILFCLVTGRVPFPFPSATEVIHAHCELERPDPRSVNPDVTPELAMFIMKLLAINPDSRPQTARAALEEFDKIASEVPEQAPAPEEEEAPPPSDEDDFYAGPEVVDALPAGTRVGRLTVEGVIGAGGMGAVYRARHDENRVSALKVLPKKFASDPKRVKAFLKEAELGKKVHSENVVETYDYGNDPQNGVAYIELELVQGTSIENLIKTGVQQQENVCINILRGAASGLWMLHNSGIIHRDVKPANILLTGEFLSRPDGGVKIIDFGLAIEKANVKKSVEGEFAGTPLYMAPEQSHKEGVVDERSDLYSLGCTIYHLACGKPPFDGKTPNAIAYQHQRTSPTSPKSHNPSLSEGFSAILEILLAKNPDERYISADALVADLANTDADGKLKKPQIHAKYRTNRLGKAGAVFTPVKAGEDAAGTPPPRRLVITAAVIAIICGLATLGQVARAFWITATAPSKQPPPPIFAPPPPPPGPATPNTPPPPPPSGTSDPKEDPNKNNPQARQKDREERINELKELTKAASPDWLEIRRRYDAIIRDYPDSPLQGIAAQLKTVSETFDAALVDAVRSAEKAQKSKSVNDWSESDSNIQIARQQISRADDEERLKRAVDRIEELRKR